MDEAIETLGRGVLASSYASVAALVYGGLEPVLELKGFVMAASRARLAGMGEEFLQEVLRRSPALYEELRSPMLCVAAKNLVREALWVVGEEGLEHFVESLTPGHVAAWLLAKVSVGRALMPWRTQGLLRTAREVLNVLEQGIDRYVSSAIEELEMLRGSRVPGDPEEHRGRGH